VRPAVWASIGLCRRREAEPAECAYEDQDLNGIWRDNKRDTVASVEMAGPDPRRWSPSLLHLLEILPRRLHVRGGRGEPALATREFLRQSAGSAPAGRVMKDNSHHHRPQETSCCRWMTRTSRWQRRTGVCQAARVGGRRAVRPESQTGRRRGRDDVREEADRLSPRPDQLLKCRVASERPPPPIPSEVGPVCWDRLEVA